MSDRKPLQVDPAGAVAGAKTAREALDRLCEEALELHREVERIIAGGAPEPLILECCSRDPRPFVRGYRSGGWRFVG